jgi:hypothetical protein
MRLTAAPPERQERPRPGLQEVCRDCGHAFVERFGDRCDGCELRRRHARRHIRALEDRRTPVRRRGA